MSTGQKQFNWGLSAAAKKISIRPPRILAKKEE